ncbi:glycosyltransferase family 4 protein [Thermodesulfobacteriota bacterium]
MSVKSNIVSPMERGSGAYIVHKYLERRLPGYTIAEYSPYWTLIPIALRSIVPVKNAALIHTTPDYARFFHSESAPLVITFQNYVLDPWMIPYSTWFQRIHYSTDLRLWTKMAVNKAHTLTAVSGFTAELVKKDLNIPHPIRVIYNCVDEQLFTPVTSSKAVRKEVRVFFSGNITRRKGAQWLPAIAKQLDTNICIYYTQGLRTRKSLLPASGLKPVGPVPFSDMPAQYRDMDILLMPTVREGFSLSMLEAMACGLPVVASDCSSIPELLDNGKGGFLCPVGDLKAFAEKINILADSPGLRKKMGEYNRAKVEEMFTLDRMVKEYKELFEQVLGQK